jgi:DNA-binding NarL/FixJ family response regulator
MTVLPDEERGALERLSLGYTIPEIADQMGVSVPTVKRWLASAYLRLGATNGYEAIQIATRRGCFGKM